MQTATVRVVKKKKATPAEAAPAEAAPAEAAPAEAAPTEALPTEAAPAMAEASGAVQQKAATPEATPKAASKAPRKKGRLAKASAAPVKAEAPEAVAEKAATREAAPAEAISPKKVRLAALKMASKKKGKKHKGSYASYIFKVLKQVHPEIGMSKMSMSVMCSFVNDLYERLGKEASTLIKTTGRKTMGSRDMAAASCLLLPGELAKHAVSEETSPSCATPATLTAPSSATDPIR
ncbi:hypothetical protein L596_024891 [Steinernema carpocapsae]|uniref:Core Histone H2A/H2B/H3 domain-containing protein n=1 Tax=Steinernema carpocapsae TaxID=34508 RepID=A0A4V5ZYW7_STECR|nr:hypothetical protein L596_024891 [Steinernema carpocapsae]